MPPKKTRTKFKRNDNETLYVFVTRIIDTSSKPMTAKEVYNSIDRDTIKTYKLQKGSHKRGEGLTLSIVQATLGYAAKKELLTKKVVPSKPIRVHYMSNAIAKKITGDDIPIPKYNKGNYNKMIHPDVMTPLEDKKIESKDRLFTPSERENVREGIKRLGITIVNEHHMTWIEVAALYHNVTDGHIMNIIMSKVKSLSADSVPVINLKDILHKELSL